MKIKFSRFVSFFLMLAMLSAPLAAFGENAEKEESAAVGSVSGSYEMNFLNSLKIVNYTEAKLANPVTNEEFAGAASLIKGSTKNYYEDGLLNALVTTGDMLSVCKYPDRTITYMQAVKALVSVLGYDCDANQKGGYPSGYLSSANKLNITKGTEKTAMDAPLTYGTLCILLYNCLDVERVAVVSYNSDGTVEAKKAGTVLNDVFEIYEAHGRVTGNTVTSLSGINELNDGRLWIDSKQYINANAAYDDYLGYNVRYWHKENDLDTDEILYMEKDGSANKVLTLNSEDGKYNKAANTYTYYRNNSQKSARLDDGYCLVYNKRVSDKGIESYADSIDGYVTLVDTNADGRYDFVEIVSYTTIYVSKINSYSRSLYDTFNQSKSVCFDDMIDESRFIFVDTEGNEIKFADIKTEDIVSVMMSADEKLAKAIVSHDKVKAKIDGVSNSKVKDSAYIASGEQKYTVAKSVLNHLSDIALGEEYQLSIDFRGDVAGFAKSSSLFDAGMIMSVVKTENAFNESRPRIMIYSTEGKKVTYSFDEKVTVDGNRYKEAADAYDALYTTDDSGNKVYKSDFIRYRVQDDAVVEIDTAYYDKKNESEQSLHQIGTTSNKTIHRDGQYFYTANGDGVVYDNAVTLFMAYLIEESRTEEKNYQIVTTSKFPSGYSVPNVTAYTTDLKCPDTKYITVGMTDSFAKSMSGENMHVVCLTSIGQKVVGDDVMQCVNAWDLQKNAAVEITVESIEKVKDFKRGDIFSYSLNLDGEFGNVYKAYDAATNKVTFTDETGVQGAKASSGGSVKWIYGMPYAAANNYVYMIPYSKIADIDSLSFADCKMVAHKRRAPQYYVYDTKNNNRVDSVVTSVERNELKDYINTGSSADTVLAFSYPSEYSAVVIFR